MPAVRTAVLFDIHGNRAALEAVLDEAEREGVDRLAFGGDLCLFGTDAPGCVDALRGYGDRLDAIAGNADRYVIERRDGATWWADQLGEQRLGWLAALPAQLTLDGHDALLVHATPRGDEDMLTPDTGDAELAAMLAGVTQQTILCGHVHIQYRRATAGGHEVTNPGSVGLPFDGDRRAAWAIAEDGRIELRRTAYDSDAVVAAVEALNAPYAAEVARRLRSARRD
jgi:predicted phosphodiesterase